MSAGHFAVIGYPLCHSISPFIHNELFKLNGISASYDLCEVPGNELGKWLSSCKLDGFNITIPHKSALLPFLDKLDEKSKMCGAVNTVKYDGGFIGYNTDGFGFLSALASDGVPLFGDVLICGNGGTAKSIAFECAANGNCNITFAVRESGFNKATEIKEKINDFFPSCKTDIILYNNIRNHYDILVNTTSVGMFPNSNNSIVDKNAVAECSFVFDCVYNPKETALISLAKECNVKHLGGLSMLVWQAVKAQEIWFSCNFCNDDINDIIKKAGDLLL